MRLWWDIDQHWQCPLCYFDWDLSYLDCHIGMRYVELIFEKKELFFFWQPGLILIGQKFGPINSQSMLPWPFILLTNEDLIILWNVGVIFWFYFMCFRMIEDGKEKTQYKIWYLFFLSICTSTIISCFISWKFDALYFSTIV